MPNLGFSEDFYDRWEHLISSVEITNVPMRLIKEIKIQFKNNDTTTFDIVELLSRGYDMERIEETIEVFLDLHDEDIDCVDFHINLTALAEEVEPRTNKLLD